MQSIIPEIRAIYNTVPSIVCNSAGITRDNFLLKMEENQWNAVMNVNLKVCAILWLLEEEKEAERAIRNASISTLSNDVLFIRALSLSLKLPRRPWWTKSYPIAALSTSPRSLARRATSARVITPPARPVSRLSQDPSPRNLPSTLTITSSLG